MGDLVLKGGIFMGEIRISKGECFGAVYGECFEAVGSVFGLGKGVFWA